MKEQGSGDGGGLPVVPPAVPRPVGPVRVKVGIIIEAGEAENEVLRVYRSSLADGAPLDVEEAFLVALGRALEVWAAGPPRASWAMPERLRVPEALRDIHPEKRRIRWETEGAAEALAELVKMARAVVEASPVRGTSEPGSGRIDALDRALESYEAQR